MVEAGGALWVAGTAQDPWSASQQGEAEPAIVARWDGTSWTRYGPESGLDLCASPDICAVSLAAAGGRVWAAGREGLFRLDGDRWTNVLPAVAPAFAERMVVTGPDEAWVIDSGAPWRLKGGRWSESPGVGRLGGVVVDLARGPDGGLWAATTFGLARFDGERWREVADVVTLTGSAANMRRFQQRRSRPGWRGLGLDGRREGGAHRRRGVSPAAGAYGGRRSAGLGRWHGLGHRVRLGRSRGRGRGQLARLGWALDAGVSVGEGHGHPGLRRRSRGRPARGVGHPAVLGRAGDS